MLSEKLGIARLQSRARIETGRHARVDACRCSIARLQSRARIETPWSALKSPWCSASPGCKAGRGLKLRHLSRTFHRAVCIARLQSRARIETVVLGQYPHKFESIARLQSRARIETHVRG